MKRILVALFLISAFVVKGQQQYPTVTISGSEVRKITTSIATGQEYELQISLPAGYESGTKKYPVVYLMDSQWDFPLLNSIYGEQYFDGFIPELIVVGVTWGGVNPNPAVGWDNVVLLKREKTFAEKKLTKPVRAHMTVGDVERGRPIL